MEGLSCTCIDVVGLLNKIVALLECEITKHNIDRILELLYLYISSSQYGVWVSDLVNIMRLLEIGCERFDSIPTFKDILLHILKICKIPPFMKVCSDVWKYTTDIREFFAVLGYVMLLIDDTEVQQHVIDVIISLLETPTQYKNQVSLEIRRKEAGEGRFSGLLGQILILIKEDLFINIVTLTLKFVLHSPKACKDLAINDALNSLFTRMEGNWKSRYPKIEPDMSVKPNIKHINTNLAVLNIILAYLIDHKEFIDEVPELTRFSLWNIKYVFCYVTFDIKWGFARNNIMTCILCCLELFPKLDLVSSGLAEVLLVEGYKFSINAFELLKTPQYDSEELYYFIKAFLFCVPLYMNFPNAKYIVEKSGVVSKMLKLFNFFSEKLAAINEHTSVIRILGYKVLNKIIPHLEDEFIENSGPVIMMNILEKVDTSPMGQSISVNVLDTVRCVLKSNNSKSVSSSLLFNNAISILLDLCKKCLKVPQLNDKIQLCLEEIFSILSVLLNNVTDTCQFEVMYLVEITIELLNRFLQPSSEELIYDNKIIINVMNFIWKVIIKYENVCDEFFEQNGVYVMCDILQSFPLPVQLVTLGALVDMCEYSGGSCIAYLMTWKGKDRITFIPLLLQIFRNENKLLGVQTGSFGEIGDSKHPLMGKAQYEEIFLKKNFNMSPTVADMFLSCRPKIYALLTLIHERYKPILDITYETYKISQELSVKDQMTLLLAENYLGLKFGEAWEELQMEFEEIGFKPIATDAHLIGSMVTRAHKWGKVLLDVQKELLYGQKLQGIDEEYDTYRILRDSRITTCLESLNEAKYIARCTERMFRVAQKFQQVDQVMKSMAKIPHGMSVHKTFMFNTPITCVFKQHVTLKSDFKCNGNVSGKASSRETLDKLDREIDKDRVYQFGSVTEEVDGSRTEFSKTKYKRKTSTSSSKGKKPDSYNSITESNHRNKSTSSTKTK